MGDIKLFDILQTLCIGVFCLALIIFFYFFYNKCFIKKKFNEKNFFVWLKDDVLKGKIQESGYLSLAVIMVYFLGIIASDLTERMTDSNNNKERSLALKELNYISVMPTVGKIRKLALIDSDDSLTTLGNSVFGSYPLIKEANRINKTFYFLREADTSLINEKSDSLARVYIKDSKFDRFISLLYYTSKNWCYSKDHEPLSELKSIQNRVDLSRSIVLLTTTALQLLILFYLFYIFLNLKSIYQWIIEPKNNLSHLPRSISSLFIKFLVIFFIITVLCRECFQICLLSYNKRAFGYYVSHLAKYEVDSENKDAKVGK